MVQKFRKKPVVVEAVQWNSRNREEIEHFTGFLPADIVDGGPGLVYLPGGNMEIPTLEGMITASPGAWIIKGVKGEFYPCKPDIFQQTYEPVEGVVPDPLVHPVKVGARVEWDGSNYRNARGTVVKLYQVNTGGTLMPKWCAKVRVDANCGYPYYSRRKATTISVHLLRTDNVPPEVRAIPADAAHDMGKEGA